MGEPTTWTGGVVVSRFWKPEGVTGLGARLVSKQTEDQGLVLEIEWAKEPVAG